MRQHICMRAAVVFVPWFLWSTVTPVGVPYFEKDIRAQPVHEYTSKKACELALTQYHKTLVQPPAGPLVELVCSPVYPR